MPTVGQGGLFIILKKPLVLVITLILYLCTVSLLSNCDACFSNFPYPDECFKVSITPVMSSHLPRASYVGFEKNSVKNEFEFLLSSLTEKILNNRNTDGC